MLNAGCIIFLQVKKVDNRIAAKYHPRIIHAFILKIIRLDLKKTGSSLLIVHRFVYCLICLLIAINFEVFIFVFVLILLIS